MCKWGNVQHFEYDGNKFQVDSCIALIVKALNDAGIKTVASCCGHNKIEGNIVLEDGRVFEIFPTFEVWKKKCMPKKVNIHGETPEAI